MAIDSHELLRRLEAFQLNDPTVSLPFSKRLAIENGWSWTYAQRAIIEYKRFAFLAMVAGHPVSPSEAVDQVWHLHLCYSQSYWEEFCPNVLQSSFHHHPTRGGSEERAKHQDWYEKTLGSYEQFFQAPPPEDIWPEAEHRFPGPRYAKIDLNRHWVLQKPQFHRGLSKRIAGIFAMMFILVAVAANPQSSNPLEWQAPVFLRFFFLLLVAGTALAFALRWLLRGPGASTNTNLPHLDRYELAYLAGGKFRAADTAMVRLLENGDLEFDETTQSVSIGTLSAKQTENPLELAILNLAAVDGSIRRVRITAANATHAIQARLADEGLLVTGFRDMAMRFVPTFLLTCILLFGVTKVFLGIERHRPVLFLVALCVATFVPLFFLMRPTARSRRGNQLLESLRSEKQASGSSVTPSTAPAIDMSTSVALFGAAVLTGTQFGYFQPHIEHEPRNFSYLGFNNSQNAGGCGGAGGGCGGGGGGCGGGCGGCGS